MLAIKPCPIPPNSLLHKYSGNGAYVDCYSTDVAGQIRFSEYVRAFYTTPLFRIERWILAGAVSRLSTDNQVAQLASGAAKAFAAWQVEERRDNELLLCDMIGRTRSWLMREDAQGSRTKLYFGSAVVPVRDPRTGKSSLGFVYRSLLGFHQIYSVLLLYSARLRIQRLSSSPTVAERDSI